MGAITPQFVFDLETRMRHLTETEYARLTANLWWQDVAKLRPSSTRKEIVTWMLSTASIESVGSGGNIAFEDLISLYTEYTNTDAAKGLKMRKQQLEDTEENGVELAAQWAADMGAQMAYWPQKQVSAAIRVGDASYGYDSQYFFSASHPLNPYNSGAGTYANLLTGAASGVYPGACPIDTSVSVDTAFNNLGKVFAYIRNLKMPNGEDPRGLRPKCILCGPELHPRAVQLSSARIIAQAAGTSGGGGADVAEVVAAWNLKAPICADELGYQTGYTHGNTTFYVVAEQLASSQLGALIYQEREPFKITYYTGEGGGSSAVDAILGRSRELEWQVHGRNVVGYGHPYLLFQVKAA